MTVWSTTITRATCAWRSMGIVGAIIGGGLLAGACGEKKEAVAPPPPEALVSEVVRRDVPVQRELVGQTRGFQDVDIRARVEGFLDVVVFAEGTLVHKGQELYRIDRKPLEASLATRAGGTRDGAGPLREDAERREAPETAGGQAGRQRAGAR